MTTWAGSCAAAELAGDTRPRPKRDVAMTEPATWADVMQITEDGAAFAPDLDDLVFAPYRRLVAWMQNRPDEDAPVWEVAVWSNLYAKLLYETRASTYALVGVMAGLGYIDAEELEDLADLIETTLPHPWASPDFEPASAVDHSYPWRTFAPLPELPPPDDFLSRIQQALRQYDQSTLDPSSTRYRRRTGKGS